MGSLQELLGDNGCGDKETKDLCTTVPRTSSILMKEDTSSTTLRDRQVVKNQ